MRTRMDKIRKKPWVCLFKTGLRKSSLIGMSNSDTSTLLTTQLTLLLGVATTR